MTDVAHRDAAKSAPNTGPLPPITAEVIDGFLRLDPPAVDLVTRHYAMKTVQYSKRRGIPERDVQEDLTVRVSQDVQNFIWSGQATSPEVLYKEIDNAAQRHTQREARARARGSRKSDPDDDPIARIPDKNPRPDSIVYELGRLFTEAMTLLQRQRSKYHPVLCRLYYGTGATVIGYYRDKRAHDRLRAAMLEICRKRSEAVHGERADLYRDLHGHLSSTRRKGSPQFRHCVETVVELLNRHA